ncbi:MAG: LysR family transcriptional regulator [Gammaproteobacteria bacterium]|jgi:DNA-binding transcriptional LysR family regulator
MDIDLLRTFLEVRRLGNFRAAADNLHVTQAAVSQRIKHLESVMNARLFIREKNNIYATPAGEQLVGAAETILSTWQQAKSSIGEDLDGGPGISLAAPAGVWPLFGHALLAELAEVRTDLTFSAETQSEAQILKRLHAQTLDLALLVAAPESDVLDSAAVATVTLSLQAREARCVQDVSARDYIHVNWGKTIRMRLAAAVAMRGTPRVSASDHVIAENFVAGSGGFALLPEPPAQGLRTIEGSPRLQCEVRALWHRRNPLDALIAGLLAGVTLPGEAAAEPLN